MYSANEIVNYLLNDGITLEFLKETSQGISPETLAEVVTLLKKIGNSPPGLNQLLQDNSFPVYDTAGTGGIGEARINTSSLVTLFAPQFGLQMIKHGGRSSTGNIGCNDFVESLGISLKNMFNSAPEYFRATGVLFLAAAYTYPVFAKSAPLRRQLPHPTLFNLLGPLLNPVAVLGKLIGVYNPETALLMAKTCQLLNENAVVVTAQDKNGFLDEASPFGVTTLHVCKNKIITTTELEPTEELSQPLSTIFIDNRQVMRDLLSLKKSYETEVAKKLIAYNLSVLCCLHVPNEVKKLYELILSNFDHHLEKVNVRISNLASFQSLHERSPIHVI